MRNLDFKYAGAWNFLPFGPEGVEIKFKDYGNIVLIEGLNKDAKPIDEPLDDLKMSSNGTGKSSIQEMIVFTLYGKTIKRPEKINIDDVVHNKIGKDCRCVVEFDKYRIVRTRMEGGKKNKNSLRLWESEDAKWDDSTELTLGSMSNTQKKIEEIVGLSYESFVNICIFTDDQRSCFLECDKNTKREIVENLLSLGEYREWFENAKSIKKETKNKIELQSKEYSLFLRNKEDAEKRLALTESKKNQWIKQKKEEQIQLEGSIELKKKELKNTDTGAALVLYQEAQELISKINEDTPEIEKERKELVDRIILIEGKEETQREAAQKVSEQLKDCSREIKYKLEERKQKEKEIEELEKEVPGSKCNKCKSTVESKNIEEYVKELKKELNEINDYIKSQAKVVEDTKEKVENVKANQEKLSKLRSQTEIKIKEIDKKLADLRAKFAEASKVKEPKTENRELIIQQKIEELKNQLSTKKEEQKNGSPFEDILQNDKDDLKEINKVTEEKKKEIEVLEKELPYYDYWISGFGEQGIRKWIIEGIIPDLNKKINYWLQFLIEGMVSLSFDNELQEKIERSPPDGDPYIYYAMSTGQRRRLNLAVGHSFAYITELSSDAIPSLIFLDEVTTNVDPLGVHGIYNMIRELAENKQVFITTHDPDLVKMLDDSSKIKLVHENGFTKKV